MDNSDVSADKMYEITEEIRNIINNITNDINSINNSCSALISDCEEFMGYNGEEVMGTRNEKPIEIEHNGELFYHHTLVTWQEWQISGCDEILTRASSIQKLITDIEDSTNSVLNLVNTTQIIADNIASYVEDLNGNMENLTEEERKLLVDYIAKYKSESEDGEIVGITEENKQWWTDDALYADSERIVNGRIPIYQIVDGQKVYMGWVPVDKWLEGVKNVQKAEEILNKVKETVKDGAKVIGAGVSTVLGAMVNSTKGTGANGKNEPGGKYVQTRDHPYLEKGYTNIKKTKTGTIYAEYVADSNNDGMLSYMEQPSGHSVTHYDSSINSLGVKTRVIDVNNNKTYSCDKNLSPNRQSQQIESGNIHTIKGDNLLPSNENTLFDQILSNEHNPSADNPTITECQYNSSTGDYTIKFSDGRAEYGNYNDKTYIVQYVHGGGVVGDANGHATFSSDGSLYKGDQSKYDSSKLKFSRDLNN